MLSLFWKHFPPKKAARQISWRVILASRSAKLTASLYSIKPGRILPHWLHLTSDHVIHAAPPIIILRRSPMALAAYRQVLRSTRVAFQGTCSKTYTPCLPRLHLLLQPSDTCNIAAGDLRILSAARVEARSKFDQSRSLSPSSTEAKRKVLEAKEVARILRQNVVQGEQVTGSENEEQRYRA